MKKTKKHYGLYDAKIYKDKPYRGYIAPIDHLIWFFVDGLKIGITQEQLENKLKLWEQQGKKVQRITYKQD